MLASPSKSGWGHAGSRIEWRLLWHLPMELWIQLSFLDKRAFLFKHSSFCKLLVITTVAREWNRPGWAWSPVGQIQSWCSVELSSVMNTVGEEQSSLSREAWLEFHMERAYILIQISNLYLDRWDRKSWVLDRVFPSSLYFQITHPRNFEKNTMGFTSRDSDSS
jgi:hypothetical protein